MKPVNFDALFENVSGLKVGVLGDVMLDTYMWGHVDRISPEAPVPIVALDKKEYRIGGAANVALNVAAMKSSVTMLSMIGEDDEAAILTKLLQENGIQTEFLLSSSRRITTNKTRIISRNQHMMRLDHEITSDLGFEDENRLILAVQNFIAREKPDVIIFEDYNKGVLTELVIEKVISLCQHHGIITAVDPKRKNFFQYKGVDIFKPNLKEVKDALSLLSLDVTVGDLRAVHGQLAAVLHHRVSFITLSEKGVFYQSDDNAAILPSHVRAIADVSGAGDTVIAIATLIYAATRNLPLMAAVANIAGGLVCEEVGTVSVRKERLLQECKHILE
jgi:D-glycero-beta-D-manno-heptose-7-phosphate kinase